MSFNNTRFDAEWQNGRLANLSNPMNYAQASAYERRQYDILLGANHNGDQRGNNSITGNVGNNNSTDSPEDMDQIHDGEMGNTGQGEGQHTAVSRGNPVPGNYSVASLLAMNASASGNTSGGGSSSSSSSNTTANLNQNAAMGNINNMHNTASSFPNSNNNSNSGQGEGQHTAVSRGNPVPGNYSVASLLAMNASASGNTSGGGSSSSSSNSNTHVRNQSSSSSSHAINQNTDAAAARANDLRNNVLNNAGMNATGSNNGRLNPTSNGNENPTSTERGDSSNNIAMTQAEDDTAGEADEDLPVWDAVILQGYFKT
jgi:hypothetical protein